jgi:outer membrane protein assembly factor BamB
MDTAGEVTISQPGRFEPGYILYSPYAGDGFYLVQREGAIVHRWQTGRYTKIAELLEGGRLLYAQMRIGVFEVDWANTEVLWAYLGRQHHDFCREPSGHTLVLQHELTFNAEVWHGAIDHNDAIVEVDERGEVVWEWHADQHCRELSELAGIKFPRECQVSDWAHTNTVEALPDTPLGRRDERFRAGNILFSSRNIHTIGAIDRPSGEVIWAFGRGELDGQHMPTMLPDGHLMVFDNGTGRGFSRVIELDPESDHIVWEFRLPEYAFARALSGQELLANGNILICAGNPGVIMEVTRAGEVVWELRNHIPGYRGSYRTAVYRATFCPPERVEPYL